MQLDPLHLGKVGPPGNVRAPFSMEYRKVIMIVFFEKAMITGLPLQNKMRTYKKNLRLFSVSRAWTPPTAKPDENFLDPRSERGYTLSWWYRNDIAP